MECNYLRENIYLFLDGEVGDKEKGELEEHVRYCSECRRYYLKEEQYLTGLHDALKQVDMSILPSLKKRVTIRLFGEKKYPWFEVYLKKPAFAVIMVFLFLLVASISYLLVSPTRNKKGTHEFEISGSSSIVKEYLQNRFPFPIHPPLPESNDIKLIGAKITRVNDMPAVIFYYTYYGKKISLVEIPDQFKKTPSIKDNLFKGHQEHIPVDYLYHK